MFSIMIVEDEPIILRDIRRKIENLEVSSHRIYEATNGKDAYEQIEQLMPDIVLTDIRMPLMDGLELVSKIRENNLPVSIAIISSYQNFDYAKQAIHLGVEEYLLKPVKAGDLSNVIKSLMPKVLKQKSEFLLRTIKSSNKASLKFSYFVVSCFSFGSIQNNRNMLQKPLYSWNNDLIDFFVKDLSHNESIWTIEGNNPNEGMVILGLNKFTEERINKFNRCLMYWGKSKKINYFTISTSNPINDFSDIMDEYTKVHQALKSSVVFSKDTLVKESNPKDVSFLYNKDVENNVSMYAMGKNIDELKKELSNLLKKAEDKCATQVQLEFCLKSFFHTVNKYTGHTLYDIESMLISSVELSTDYNELNDRLYSFIDVLFSGIELGEEMNICIEKIHRYIIEHFTEKLTLNLLSQQFNISQSYLSKMFKKLYNISPMEYLIELRIQRAKEIIKSMPKLRFREVSQAVGYSDPLYFSRIFKTYTGYTPSDYKLNQSSKMG